MKEEPSMRLPLGIVLTTVGLVTGVVLADIEQLQRDFAAPPDDARIMMRWWWFGPAVTQPQLEREMKLMKAGGIGGFEVQPVYPLVLDEQVPGVKNHKFLSPEFLDALTFTSQRAKELGLRFDLTLGSGWPYGGPQIPITQAAGKLRIESTRFAADAREVSLPRMADGDKLLAAFLGKQPLPLIEFENGVLPLPNDVKGPGEVVFYISGRTRMMVKRAAFGAEGFVIDHYDPAAIDTFMKQVADVEMKAVADNPPYAVFCDSLESYGNDWTPDLLEQFEKRRGYDLRPHLPALLGDRAESADIRHDWGLTLAELTTDRFFKAFHTWAKANNTRFRIQGYGIPPSMISSYIHADLSEGEGHQWKTLTSARWSASAGHLLDRPVTSSETWTWLHSPVFRASPLDMKAEADLHFLQGINQLIGHGWPYTADGVDYPGWRFYAAAVFNEKNPWWIVMPEISSYLQRASFMLRQGAPANDVALYLSNSDAFSGFSPGRVSLLENARRVVGRDIIPAILEAGYNVDLVDDGLIDRIDRYRIVILPGVQRIPPATLRRLEAFAANGGILVATRRLPELAPGRLASEQDSNAVGEITERLFEAPFAPGIFVQDETKLAEALAARLRPDVSFDPPTRDLGFVHRRTDAGDVYFLANTGNTKLTGKANFRVEKLQPQLWDPLTGQTRGAQVLSRGVGQTSIAIDLPPYGSQFVVFSGREASTADPAAGAELTAILDLSQDWNVRFAAAAAPVPMPRLRSWTEEQSTKHFSGVAVYERSFTVSEPLPGGRVLLSFGPTRPTAPPAGRGARQQALLEAPVREAAVIYLNDRRAGAVWCPPYTIDVTEQLRAGENRLRIDVANLAINHLAGQPPADYRALIERFGDRFQPQDMNLVQPISAGLLGPIQLLAAEARP
jgi:hypothetical protein